MKIRFDSHKKQPIQSGQALLTLLVFMSIGITMLTAATIVLVTNIFGSVSAEQGLNAYYAAESGAEDGYLHLLRNPSYNGTLPAYTVGDAQTSVIITNGTIVATGSYGDSVRKIQIQTTNMNGAISITSWQEIN
jgi:hypothetical protein